jgi:peptide chain release factor subunit 1
MTTRSQTSVEDTLDRLALLEPTEFPVVSLYLDLRPKDAVRDVFPAFLRKELHQRIESYPLRSPERDSLEEDFTRIEAYVRDSLPREARSLALFACSAAGLFEAQPLEVVAGESRLHIGRQPHLYPLAHRLEEYRRYAALLADTHVARLFVFGLGRPLEQHEVVSPKTRRTMVGGWSQMRYQRHVDHRHLKHAKEAAAALTRVVRDERIEQVILSGDDVILPLLREELPKDISARVIDTLSLPVHTADHEILKSTLEAFRRHDAADDVEAVATLVDEFRGGGLAVVGVSEVRAALEAGQADELLLAAAPLAIDRGPDGPGSPDHPALPPDELARREALGGDLVARARRTGASVRFIEDPNLLWDVGGVGAFLRYRLTPEGPAVAPVEIPEPTL